MRSGAAAVAVIATVVTTAFATEAVGDEGAYPSQQQVNQAQTNVQKKLTSVKAIQQALQAAQDSAEAAQTRAEIAAEAYNGAMWKLSLAQTATQQATEAAAAAEARVKAQRDGIARLAAASYMDATEFTSLNAVLGGSTPAEMLQRAGVVEMANAPMQAAFDKFTQASADAATAKQNAETAQAAQQTLANQAAQAKNSAAGAAAAAQQAVDGVASQRDQLLKQLADAQHVSLALATQRQNALEAIARTQAQARARAAAEAAAKAAADKAAADKAAQKPSSGGNSGSNSGGSSTPPPSTPPPTSSGIAAVINFAKAQLGDPYVWAGAGPNSWDCSGLTMMAFRQIGINLPHYAASQYTMGTPVPVSQAQPGDLYFWSSNGTVAGIHHVAIALGNGAFIEAPRTGANVRYNNVNNWYPTFAARM